MIEVLVTIVISSILLGIISSNFPALKRTANRFLQQSIFEQQYLIFLLRLEDEYRQVEITNESDFSFINQFSFRSDLNLDGDYLDSGERISYRWNESLQRIDRKSGKGYFQAHLDGVTYLAWTKSSTNPLCHKLEISNIFSTQKRSIIYCRLE